MSPSIAVLYSPFPSAEAAREAARALLDEKRVACCNILPVAESHYLWEGKHVVAKEWVLIAKTLDTHAQEAAARLGVLHPYSTPAILSFAAVATPAFAAWVASALAQNTPTHSQ